MQESESYIETLHHESFSTNQAILEPLFDNPKTYGQWEAGHFRLMKSIAEDMRVVSQAMRLRKTCFALMHQKALFEFLRNNKIVGNERNAIFSTLFTSLDYSNAVIAEHGRYLRSTWSFVCADHLSSALLHDGFFEHELENYQAIYADYFAAYCGRIIAENRGEEFALEPLITHLKVMAAEKRKGMLTLPVSGSAQIKLSAGRAPATSTRHRPRARPYYC